MHDKNAMKSENVKLGIYFCNKYEKKLTSLTYKYLLIINNKKTNKLIVLVKYFNKPSRKKK